MARHKCATHLLALYIPLNWLLISNETVYSMYMSQFTFLTSLALPSRYTPSHVFTLKNLPIHSGSGCILQYIYPTWILQWDYNNNWPRFIVRLPKTRKSSSCSPIAHVYRYIYQLICLCTYVFYNICHVACWAISRKRKRMRYYHDYCDERGRPPELAVARDIRGYYNALCLDGLISQLKTHLISQKIVHLITCTCARRAVRLHYQSAISLIQSDPASKKLYARFYICIETFNRYICIIPRSILSRYYTERRLHCPTTQDHYVDLRYNDS